MMMRGFRAVSLRLYIFFQIIILFLIKTCNKLTVHFATRNINLDLEKKWIEVDQSQACGYYFEGQLRRYKISSGEMNFIKLLAKKTQLVNKKSPVDYAHGILLFSLVKNHPRSNLKIAEIGTAKGFSALCMSAAINRTSKSGVIITTDIIPNTVKRYWNDAGDPDGRVSRGDFIADEYDALRGNIMFLSMTSFNVSHIVDFPHIDVWFFDGVHSANAIRNEYAFAKKSSSLDTIYVFDDCTDDYKEYKSEVKYLLTEDGMKFSLVSSNWGRKKFYIASKSGIHNEVL